MYSKLPNWVLGFHGLILKGLMINVGVKVSIHEIEAEISTLPVVGYL